VLDGLFGDSPPVRRRGGVVVHRDHRVAQAFDGEAETGYFEVNTGQ